MRLLTSEDGVIWKIELVKQQGNVAVHYVEPAEEISDVPNIFCLGKRVNLAFGHTGFQRRLDHVSPPPFLAITLSCHPQMSLHTAQHLLSSVIDTGLKVPTLT